MSERFDSSSHKIAQGVLVYEHIQARLVLESLLPDNTSEMHMELHENRIVIRVAAQSLRTLIATCDDLLVNLQVATEILADVSSQRNGGASVRLKTPNAPF